MREAQFTRSVNQRLPKQVYCWKVSDRFTAGVPDSWYSGPKADLWIEWKYEPNTPRFIKPKLSPLQNRWLNSRHREGRNVAVIVGTPKGSLIFENGEWITHKEARDLLTRDQVVDWINKKVTGNAPNVDPDRPEE